MILSVVEILISLILPSLIIKFRKNKFISLIGTVGTSYLAGILFSVLISIFISSGIITSKDTTVNEILAYVGISLAIPLLLFSNNIKYVLKLSKETLVSFLLLIVSVAAVSGVLFAVYSRNIEYGDIFSGMAVALYTGGTPNLNAVAYFFQLDNNLIFTANISDIIFGGIFYVFLLFAAKPIVSKILRTSDNIKNEFEGELFDENTANGFAIKDKGNVKNLFFSLLIVIISAAVGVFVWFIKGCNDGTLTNNLVPALMIGATVGGIFFSFIPSVSRVKGNNIMGQYFAAVFGYSIASMINFGDLGTISFGVFSIFAVITVGSFFVHLILCKIFGVHAETMIITSTAGIYGPAFIPSVSKAINAEYLLASGLITGSLGYAIGTFLGISFVFLINLI